MDCTCANEGSSRSGGDTVVGLIAHIVALPVGARAGAPPNTGLVGLDRIAPRHTRRADTAQAKH
eukprot:7391128-Prymnesium_polylepis.2